MPARVKVGAIIYDIRLVPRLVDSGGKLDGHVSHQQAIIEVEQGMHHQAQVQTLLHELVHTVGTQLGVPRVEEGMVDAIAYAAYQVLRDNPDLVQFIGRQE